MALFFRFSNIIFRRQQMRIESTTHTLTHIHSFTHSLTTIWCRREERKTKKTTSDNQTKALPHSSHILSWSAHCIVCPYRRSAAKSHFIRSHLYDIEWLKCHGRRHFGNDKKKGTMHMKRGCVVCVIYTYRSHTHFCYINTTNEQQQRITIGIEKKKKKQHWIRHSSAVDMWSNRLVTTTTFAHAARMLSHRMACVHKVIPFIIVCYETHTHESHVSKE